MNSKIYDLVNQLNKSIAILDEEESEELKKYQKLEEVERAFNRVSYLRGRISSLKTVVEILEKIQ